MKNKQMQKQTLNKRERKKVRKVFKWLVGSIFLYVLIYFFIDIKWLSGVITGLLLILFQLIRIKRRGFFWIDKFGNKLTFKQFMSRFKQGVEGITPIQQTKTTLWSMIPIFAGIIWGIVMTIFSATYWLALILAASLPITIINFISTLQKYWRQKATNEQLKLLEVK